MNELVPSPRPSSPPAAAPGRRAVPAARAVSGRDREFLPAALEILETPPSPLPIALISVICIFVCAALIWSYFGRLDVYAVAAGKTETSGYSKLIQPLDQGKVAAIHVETGQRVKAGDLLLELDPTEAQADATAARLSLEAGLAEIARRHYAIAAVRTLPVDDSDAGKTDDDAPSKNASSRLTNLLAGPSAIGIDWGSDLPEAARLREEAVLRADLAQLSDSLTAFDKQMAQKIATRQRLNMSIAYENTLLETLNQRVSMRQQAIDMKVDTKVNLYDAQESLEKSQAALASDKGQLIEADAALRELQSEKAKAISQFIADNQTKLAEASRKADEAREELAKAEAKLARTKFFAPIDGVVQQTAVTTVGQVVTTGQQLVVITPKDGKLQIQALVANLDIGFVKLGQDAVIKVDAFPFTRFGVLRGKVVEIASEAIDEQDAKRALANAAAAANATQAPPSAPGQPENFVFPITIALDEDVMTIDGKSVPLTPGMTVTAEIKTDSRRVIDYLLSPLAKIASEAARER